MLCFQGSLQTHTSHTSKEHGVCTRDAMGQQDHGIISLLHVGQTFHLNPYMNMIPYVWRLLRASRGMAGGRNHLCCISCLVGALRQTWPACTAVLVSWNTQPGRGGSSPHASRLVDTTDCKMLMPCHLVRGLFLPPPQDNGFILRSTACLLSQVTLAGRERVCVFVCLNFE